MKIQAFSNMWHVSVDTLRYYERIGLIPPVQRNASGIREYSADDGKWLKLVKELRKIDMPIEGIAEYSQLLREGDAAIEKRRAALQKHKHNLTMQRNSLQRSINVVERKLANFEELDDIWSRKIGLK